jgi:hypothetical protein
VTGPDCGNIVLYKKEWKYRQMKIGLTVNYSSDHGKDENGLDYSDYKGGDLQKG